MSFEFSKTEENFHIFLGIGCIYNYLGTLGLSNDAEGREGFELKRTWMAKEKS